MPRVKQAIDKKETMLSVLTLSGLGEKESKLYWILLNEGVIPASVLIKRSGLKKGNTYAILHQLAEKNLVRTFMKDKKQYFQPEPPHKVLQLLQKRSEETNLATQYFEQILPDLSSQYKKAIGKPVVQYYEGKEGVRRVMETMYSAFSREVYGCVQPQTMKKDLWSDFLKRFMPFRIKNKVYSKVLRAGTSEKGKLIEEQSANLKTLYFVDPAKYPLPAEIDVSDDKVSVLSFKEDEFIGMTIENKDFATSLKSIYRLCFDLLNRQPKREER